jgi:hypothetical protein
LPANYTNIYYLNSIAARRIAHNRNRAPKKIIAQREEADEIRVIRLPDR